MAIAIRSWMPDGSVFGWVFNVVGRNVRGFGFVGDVPGRNSKSLSSPFPQIDEFATFAAKRPERVSGEFHRLLAGWTQHGSNDPSNHVIFHAVGNLHRVKLSSSGFDI